MEVGLYKILVFVYASKIGRVTFEGNIISTKINRFIVVITAILSIY